MILIHTLMSAAKPSAPLPPTRTKSNCGRARGLVHGTGRARPALKRANSKQGPAPTVATVAPIAPEPTKPDSPVKTKSVIDQSPLPLYCSDDCRLVDLHKLDDGFSYDFNPDRHRPISAVSLSAPSVADSDVESPTGSSDTDSTSSSSSYTHASARSYQEMDPSIATLAAVYGFPSLPPPPPVRPDVAPVPVSNPAEEYVTGIMMAGRRIKETLCPDPPKRSAFSSPSARYTSSLTRSRKPIAGWTDGSDAWRASVYSLSAPRDWTVVDPKNPENRSSAYASCIATPHRSSGVVSTLGEGPSSSVAAALAARPGSKASPDALQELYGDYPLFNTARAESRMRMYPGSPQSLPSRPASQCSGRTTRECGILPKQAEGKLLVPNITLRRNTSSASVASMSSLGSNGPRSPRALTRRGSAMSDDVIHEEDETVRCPAVPSSSLPTTMRSTAGTSTYWMPNDLLLIVFFSQPGSRSICPSPTPSCSRWCARSAWSTG